MTIAFEVARPISVHIGHARISPNFTGVNNLGEFHTFTPVLDYDPFIDGCFILVSTIQ